MLANLVKVSVPAPGSVDVGTVVALGTSDTGFATFHAAFGVGAPAYFALSDGAGRTLFGTWVTGTGTGGAPVATVQEIIWNVRTNSVAAENFTSACVAWNALPSQRTADKAYADAAPAERITTGSGVWGGNYDLLPNTDTLFASAPITDGTKRLLLSGYARVSNTSATLCNAIFSARIERASDGALLFNLGEAGLATSRNDDNKSTGLRADAMVGALTGARLAIYGKKDASVGPFPVYNVSFSAIFVR